MKRGSAPPLFQLVTPAAARVGSANIQQNHRDIVTTAELVGGVDQCLGTGGLIKPISADQRGNFIIAQQIIEAVGTKQVTIAFGQGENGRADGGHLLRTEHLQQDVFLRRLPCFLGGQQALIHMQLHQRVITGQRGELAIAQTVQAGVANMGNDKRIGVQQYRHYRGAHAGTLRIALGALADLPLRFFNADQQLLLQIVQHRQRLVGERGMQAGAHGIHRDGTGDFASIGAAHAISQHGKPASRIGKHRVLVAAAYATDVTQRMHARIRHQYASAMLRTRAATPNSPCAAFRNHSGERLNPQRQHDRISAPSRTGPLLPVNPAPQPCQPALARPRQRTMELVFEAVQGPFAAGTASGAALARIDRSGGIIGRSPECQLVLDDADRTVSRQHAGIRLRGGEFVLEVLSQVNPVQINGETHAFGSSVALHDGDELIIGPFTLRLSVSQPVAAVEPVSAAMAEAASPSGPFDAQRALQALSQGLGFPLRASSDQDAQAKLNLYGEMLAEALEGLRRLMLQRAESKSELVPANRTIVVASDRNPIKHGATRQEMLSLLFSSEAIAAGIVDPVGAVRDAMTDVRQHEDAMLTGLHGAVDGALSRLAPETMDKEVTGGFLPALRKAALWDHYCKRHAELSADMKKAGSTGIWDDFKRAYNDEVTRLKAKK